MHSSEMSGLAEIGITAKVVFNVMVGIFASITAYLNINEQALALYFTLLSIDLFTGVMASFIVKEGITLSRFYAGILSKALLFIIPIVVAIIVKIQGESLYWFIKWTVIVLAVSEGISIFNNVLKAKGKQKIPEFDAIGMIGNKLRVILERLFDTAGGKK